MTNLLNEFNPFYWKKKFHDSVYKRNKAITALNNIANRHLDDPKKIREYARSIRNEIGYYDWRE